MRDEDHLRSTIVEADMAWQNRHGKVKAKLETLTPAMASMARAHQQACRDEGIELLIYCTDRPNEVQAKLYAQGRTTPGKIVTNARPGQSAHNPDKLGFAHAYDCVPLRFGKPVWTTASKEDSALWARVGSLGEAAGLVWSGRWTGKLKEMAHFQDPEWVKPQ